MDIVNLAILFVILIFVGFRMGQEFQKSKDIEKVAKLKEFAIWMTGCGYDFAQHEYFREQRDELLK